MCLESPPLNIYLFFDVLSLDQIFSGNVVLDSLVHLSTFFWLFDLDSWECCCLVWGSVLWYLIRLTWATWGSLASCLMCPVEDFEESIFLASCFTLLAENFSRSILESLMVLETNSLSFRKNEKIFQCKILAASGEYLARDTWTWTALYHSSAEWLPCLKLVQQVKSGSNLIGLWLEKIFILGPNNLQTEIFCGQAPWHILIHSKISTPHYDFLSFF